ncbi:ABC transporter substrate-binding protein [candidate division CSSED10-310 bacterium]|uniref:ABC transporter substrate-binding protein n=1 Tax=candidate division CSSED10-310 bacterium TaxID=2855610 RepID=A0ABV6Z3Z8_UNCC1
MQLIVRTSVSCVLMCSILMYLIVQTAEAVIQPAYGGQIITPLSVVELELDPLRIYNWEHLWIGRHLYETLVQFQNGEPRAALARAWSSTDNKKVWQFYIREGVYFADQRPLTATDVKLSLQRTLLHLGRHSLSTPLTDLVGADEFIAGNAPGSIGITVKDEKTLELRFKHPQHHLISELAQLKYAVLAQGHYDQHAPVGTGPFFIKSYTPGRTIQVLDRNKNYYRGRPYLDKIIISLGVTPTEAQQAFEAEEYDFIFQVPGMRIIYPYQENTKFFRQKRLHSVGTMYFDLNTDHVLLKNAVFRKAIKLALDLESIQKILLKGEGSIARSFISPHLSLHHTLHEPLEFNPGRARQLVQSLQRTDSRNQSFVLYVPSGYRLLKYIAGRIQVNLLDTGIKMIIEEQTLSEIEQRISAAEYDSALRLYFPESPDPYLILKTQIEHLFSIPIETRKTILQPIRLQLALSEEIAHSESQRMTNLFRFENELLKRNIIIPLFHPSITWLEKRNLYGLAFTSTGLLELENVWIKPAFTSTEE